MLVEFAGQIIHPKTQLCFGRAAELQLDPGNPYLHRRAGLFERRGDDWWICNVGHLLPLSVVAADGIRAQLLKGAELPLPGRLGLIRIRAGRTLYELSFCRSGEATAIDPGQEEAASDERTRRYGVQLRPREIDILVTMAKHRLLSIDRPQPTQAEVAHIWCISPRTVEKNLENVKHRLAENGIRFGNKTDGLVAGLVANGFITLDDLAWANLDGPGKPRPASGRPVGNHQAAKLDG